MVWDQSGSKARSPTLGYWGNSDTAAHSTQFHTFGIITSSSCKDHNFTNLHKHCTLNRLVCSWLGLGLRLCVPHDSGCLDITTAIII